MANKLTFVASLLFVITDVNIVVGFGRGAPGDVEKTEDAVCNRMFPEHFNQSFQHEDDIPFLMTIRPKDQLTIEVDLETMEGWDALIMGFLVQGRDADGRLIGTFDTSFTANTTLTCNNTSITQKRKLWKEKVTLVWRAPMMFNGSVNFTATVLKNTTEFWMIHSNEKYPVDTTNYNEEKSTVCGKLSGCFKCPDAKCMVSWKKVDRTIHFEVEARVKDERQYVAVALSKDDKMGSDSVTECFKNESGHSVVRMSWNEGYNHEDISELARSLVPSSSSVSYSDKTLRCSFAKYILSTDDVSTQNSPSNKKIYYPGDAEYFLFVAIGDVVNDKCTKHSDIYFSQSSLNLTSSQDHAASTNSIQKFLIKAHGTLMVVAWLVCASFASLLPRYFKKKLQGVTICNKPFWFALHQILMLTVAFLTLVAVIIIFIEAGGYASIEDPGSAHPPLGIIVTILVVLNPMMAMFRCNPTSQHRWLFNVLHFFVGQSSLVLAVVTIFLSFSIKKANISPCTKWVLVTLVCWHVFMELFLHAHETFYQSRVVLATEEIPMTNKSDNPGQEVTHKNSNFHQHCPTLILGAHLAGVLLLSSFIVGAIFLA